MEYFPGKITVDEKTRYMVINERFVIAGAGYSMEEVMDSFATYLDSLDSADVDLNFELGRKPMLELSRQEEIDFRDLYRKTVLGEKDPVFQDQR